MCTLYWEDGTLYLLDQRLLPGEEKYVACRHYEQVAEAIRTMQVRGAPAIGAAAAFGVVLGAKEGVPREQVLETLRRTRPTAVNLFWALERMRRRWEEVASKSPAEQVAALLAEAQSIYEADIQANRQMGAWGSELVPSPANILTICNAGALATCGYGTALGVVRAAAAAGKEVHVYACETRPLLQGARLTVWELQKENIPVTLITDSMAGYLMQQGKIDLVVTGADRVTVQGDVANKIGTYTLAVLAHYHHLPFYVAAPLSTFDPALQTGAEIPVEERDGSEVRRIQGFRLVPDSVGVYNPAFDVTPHFLIAALITEKGVIYPPFAMHLKAYLDF